MKPSKTSKGWMHEHVSDFYVQQAKKLGYRSRAAFKLLEIDERDHLLKPGMTVVDLGAVPGGWSQVAAQKVGRQGKVIALDILEMAGIPGVTFIQGDFTEQAVADQLIQLLNGHKVDLVISDMAPNISGVGLSDQARSIYLAELAMEFAMQHMKPKGAFLVKVFQGSGFSEFMGTMRSTFKQVLSRKPKASRDRSSELYLLGKDLIEKSV